MSTKDDTSKIISPQLLPVEKDTATRISTVLTNIVKMLTQRNLINADRENEVIKKIISTTAEDQVYRIELDNYESYYGQGNKILIIKIIGQKLTGVSKASGIYEFLNYNKLVPKILVVQAINSKVKKSIENDYLNTEIFKEVELMIDLIKYIAIPQHILLTEEETKRVKSDYKVSKKKFPKILMDDPVARYYNVKPGMLFRIIRPSETAGQSPYYRLVVRGQVKDK